MAQFLDRLSPRGGDVVELSLTNRDESGNPHNIDCHALLGPGGGVGKSVRIFFGNAGPDLTSSFHVIGSTFKKVYRDSDVLSPPSQFVQTVGVPPGDTTIVDRELLVPRTYTLVDHAIFRLKKGAVGYLNVSGTPRPDIYEAPSHQPLVLAASCIHECGSILILSVS